MQPDPMTEGGWAGVVCRYCNEPMQSGRYHRECFEEEYKRTRELKRLQGIDDSFIRCPCCGEWHE